MNLEFGTIRAGEAASLKPKDSSRFPSRAKLRRRLHLSLMALDVIAIFLGFFLAGVIYPPGSAPEQWLFISAVITPIYVGAALNAHAYSAEVIATPSLGIFRAMRAFIVAAGIVILVAFFLKASESYSRVTLGLGSLISPALLAFTRDIFLRKARKIVGGTPYTIALITDGSHTIPTDGFSLVIGSSDMLDPADDSPTMFDRLATVLSDVDRVVVTCAPESRQRWVRVLKGAGIQSEIVMPELAELAPLGVRQWEGATTLVVADGPLSKFDATLKRSFDIVVAGSALLVLAPLFVCLAILIKLESPGPVFFIQKRIGQSNRQFQMFKFRSMRNDLLDHAAAKLTTRDDARVTRVGKFIRKTSIDELPQLLNVLLGHMSIVGPRPHALGARAANKLYWEVDDRYWHRHAAKPGLTGLAQVRGFRGATDHESDLTNRLQADLEYLNHWSIWKDLKIIIMTFGVLVHENAY